MAILTTPIREEPLIQPLRLFPLPILAQEPIPNHLHEIGEEEMVRLPHLGVHRLELHYVGDGESEDRSAQRRKSILSLSEF